ncbi:MAG: M28 family peptidase [Clostridia bacterium]|nr:M28 family peptidase [Clostridia bacterium]
MTETTEIILERFQVRKTRKQKEEFTAWLTNYVTSVGYDIKIEKGLFRSRNIVIGNPEKAKVTFTAHYDTCAAMPIPNFITPKNILVYLLYQLVLVCLIFLLSFCVTFAASFLIPDFAPIFGLVSLYVLLFLMVAGPANKHTANDNTSGVTTVVDTLTKMPDELRNDVAFILFDFEEIGLLGSYSYYRKHRKVMKNKLLVNFDCVSDGNNILIVAQNSAEHFASYLQTSFSSDNGINVEVATKGVFYPSDQANFPYGVGVAALKKTKGGLLYMDKIHTKKDTVYEEKNIEFLCSGSIKLTELLAKK